MILIMNSIYRFSLLALFALSLLTITTACKNDGSSTTAASTVDHSEKPLEHLLQRYLKAYPHELTAISQNEKDSAILVAMEAYNAGRYEEAIDLFPNNARSLEQAGYIQLYHGISQLMANKNFDAFNTFQRIQSSMGKAFEISNWYLVMNYVEFNNVYEARQKLEKIVADGAYPTEEAKALLKDLPKKQ